jgi:HK97 family phage major capsid protein
MPYSEFIARGDAAALIPPEVSREIIKTVPVINPLLSMARRLSNMSKAVMSMPVMSALATAYFVNGDTGLKQATSVGWENKYVHAEEVACIVPIAESVLDDSDYDIWGEVRPAVEEAISAAITAAILFGTNIPAAWVTDLDGYAGILAGAVATGNTVDLSTQIAAGQDLYDVIMGEDGVIAKVENDGFLSTGSIASVNMRGKLRGLREKVWNGTALVSAGQPIFTRSMQDTTRYELDGSPIYFPTDGSIDPLQALLFVGDWTKLVYSMRQDITYKVLTEAVIQDGAGKILYNLAQQDMVALRVVTRLGVALPNPVSRLNPVAGSRFPMAVLVP